MSLFIQATRLKLRFESGKGNCSAEDLWDLTLPQLDKMYGKMVKESRDSDGDSLLSSPAITTEERLAQLKIDIVKFVVETKLEEKEARATRADKKMKRDKIDSLIADKQDEAMKDLSVEELTELRSNV